MARFKKGKIKDRLNKAIEKFERAKEKMMKEATLENIHEYNRASCDVGRLRQLLGGKETKAQQFMDEYSVPNHIFL